MADVIVLDPQGQALSPTSVDKAHRLIQAGKAVLAAEYTDTGIRLEDFCPQAQALQFSAILKRRNLDAYREGCP